MLKLRQYSLVKAPICLRALVEKTVARSNYADVPTDDRDGGVREHRLNLGDDSRAYTPLAGEMDGDGDHGNLAQSAMGGDWSWQPHASSVHTPTLRPKRHPRAAACCGLTACLSLIHPASACA